jgi:sulfoxide reductase catalytic subunit YedY
LVCAAQKPTYLSSHQRRGEIMANRWTNKLTQADITPAPVFLNRRRVLAGLGLGAGAAAGLGGLALSGMPGTVHAQETEVLEPNS